MCRKAVVWRVSANIDVTRESDVRIVCTATERMLAFCYIAEVSRPVQRLFEVGAVV